LIAQRDSCDFVAGRKLQNGGAFCFVLVYADNTVRPKKRKMTRQNILNFAGKRNWLSGRQIHGDRRILAEGSDKVVRVWRELHLDAACGVLRLLKSHGARGDIIKAQIPFVCGTSKNFSVRRKLG